MYNQAVVNAVSEVADAALALDDLLRQRRLQNAKMEASPGRIIFFNRCIPSRDAIFFNDVC